MAFSPSFRNHTETKQNKNREKNIYEIMQIWHLTLSHVKNYPI